MKKILLLIFIFLAIGLGRQLYLYANSSAWSGSGRTNFVVQGKEVTLLSVSSDGEGVVIPFSSEIIVGTTHGYGTYKIGSIYPLGELDKRGGDLLRGSIQELLGIPVSAYMDCPGFDFGSERTDTKLKKIMSELAVSALKKKCRTNFTSWDLVRLWLRVRDLLPSKITTILPNSTSAYSTKTLPDNSRVGEIDPSRIDQTIAKYFKEQKIRDEDYSISVLNGSEEQGLAQHASRIISNIGGRVVQVGSYEDKNGQKVEDLCLIFAQGDTQKAYTIIKLQRTFGCRIVDDQLDNRSDISIVFGKKYWQYLNEK